jgi:hypothetical protein
MEEQKPSVNYEGRIYQVKAILKVAEPGIKTSQQVALVIRDQGKDHNEILLVNMIEFYAAFEKRVENCIEIKNGAIIPVGDWMRSFKEEENE